MTAAGVAAAVRAVSTFPGSRRRSRAEARTADPAFLTGPDG
jgi:hypothetical protein